MGGRMTCQRCQGLMVASKLWDDMISVDILSHYCLNCGEMIDRVIVSNRVAYPVEARQSS